MACTFGISLAVAVMVTCVFSSTVLPEESMVRRMKGEEGREVGGFVREVRVKRRARGACKGEVKALLTVSRRVEELYETCLEEDNVAPVTCIYVASTPISSGIPT